MSKKKEYWYYYTFTHQESHSTARIESWRVGSFSCDLDTVDGLLAFIKHQESLYSFFFLVSWKRLEKVQEK